MQSTKASFDWSRLVGTVALIAAVISMTCYLVLVVSGQIPKQNRLGVSEIALAVVVLLFFVLAVHPTALDRLSLLKLPGGIEVTLEKIQQQQVEQRRELDAFFAILSNLLSLPEKYHLRTLARGDQEYTGQGTLREELFRLKRFGLIDELPGQKIGDMLDGRQFMLASFVQLTQQGERFVKALDKIEA
jgi:hypothetical protein